VDPTSTLLRLRAIGVLPQIDKVKKEHGTRLAMVPMLLTEPVGIPALEALSRTRVALTRLGPAMRAEGDPVDDRLRDDQGGVERHCQVLRRPFLLWESAAPKFFPSHATRDVFNRGNSEPAGPVFAYGLPE